MSGLWVALGTAAVGAYGAHEQAAAANKPRTGYTDSTSTQTPYMAPNINPNLENGINYQNLLLQRGAPQVDSHGNVTYAALPGQPGAQGTGPAYSAPAPASGSKGGAGGGAKPQTWVNAKGQTMTMGPGGKAVPAPDGTQASGTGGSAAPTYTTPQSILSTVAQRGFDAGNTSTVGDARNAMHNILGGAGSANGGTDTDQTGFEGSNPILNSLARTVGGNVQSDNGEARSLLLGFLGQGGGTGGASGGPGSSGGITPGSSSGGALYMPGNQYLSNPAVAAAAGGGGVPDTMKGSSFFADQTKKMFDDPTNDADIQTMIDAMNADAQRGMYADKASIDAAAQGSGRLGGDTWKGMSNDAERTADTSMLNNAATVRVGQRNQTMQERLAALGLVNQRDLGLLDANTSRANASTAASASAAGAASAAGIATRGQNLEAINSLMSNEQFNQNQYGQLGNTLSSNQLASLGMVPGLEGIGLSGLNTALGAAGQDVSMRGQDMGLREAQIGAGVQRQGLNQQLGMFNASQAQGSVNDYLNTMLRIGGMGGTSTTNGTNVQPGSGYSPTGAALLGAAGGAAAGYGAYNQYHG